MILYSIQKACYYKIMILKYLINKNMILWKILNLSIILYFIDSNYIYRYNYSLLNFKYLYNKCSEKIKKCGKKVIILNNYSNGYEYYNRLINSSNCELCHTLLFISHFVKCKNGIIKTYKGYIPNRYSCHNETNEVYGTDYIQSWIRKKQNPIQCTNKKYLILPYWGSGFGSQLHVMGSFLALALNTERIALIHSTILNNYILPLTNCTRMVKNCSAKSYNPYSNEIFVYQNTSNKINKYPRYIIPTYILDFLYKSPIFKSYFLQYWRMQASRYIYRLRDKTKRIVKNQIKKYLKCNY